MRVAHSNCVIKMNLSTVYGILLDLLRQYYTKVVESHSLANITIIEKIK